MKEEELKKIISKSTVETSDDFINNLINAIGVEQQAKNTTIWWSFKTILICCSTLVLLIVGLLSQVIDNDRNILNLVSFEIPKTPLFLMITFAFLYYINSIVRLNFHNSKEE